MANHDTTSTVTGDEVSDWGLAPHPTGSKTETKIGLSLVVVLLGALAFLVYRKMNNQGLSVAAAEDSQPAAQLESEDGQLGPSPQAAPVGFEATVVTDDAANGPPPRQFKPVDSFTPDWDQPQPTAAPTASTDPWMNDAVAVDAAPAQSSAEPNPFAADALPLSVPDARDGEPADSESQSWSSDDSAANPLTFPETAASDADVPTADGPIFDLFGGDSAGPTDPATPQDVAAEVIRPGAEPLLIDTAPRDVIPTGGDDFGAVEVDQAGGDGGAWDLGSSDGVEDPFADPAPAGEAPQPPIEFELDSNAGDPSPAPAPEFNLEPTPAPVFTPPAETDVDHGTPWSPPASTVQRPAPVSDPFVGATVGGGTFDDNVTIHTVESHDSFWSISRQHYGSGKYFNALAAYNRPRIPDPRAMRPGMKVLIPDVSVLEQRFPNLAGVAYSPNREAKQPGFFVSTSGEPMYRVGKNDTLSSIAVRHLGRASRWRQILGMNSSALKGADSLKIGMELRLPPDATRVTVVPSNVSVR